MNEFLDIVVEKEIHQILDVRRSPINRRNSAKWFMKEPFDKALWEKAIHYLHLPIISNRKRTTDIKEFFTEDIKVALDALVLPESVYGIVCYCEEKIQQHGLCHAEWIADYLADKYKAEVIV